MIHTDTGWEQEDTAKTFAPRSTGSASAVKQGSRRCDDVKDDPDVEKMSEVSGVSPR